MGQHNVGHSVFATGHGVLRRSSSISADVFCTESTATGTSVFCTESVATGTSV
ncbi:hypothetical protein [Lysinibacillus sp. fls2-241-R2A-57]|uniref:hypothetical protein n=1 Tax=Lysinibacillus sp. fls2-241-R2A-57 TaxID=3040292 RepID=UPI002552F95B|nr:hypothetical protein [Lysinibacillus sp. fls2-241-R2A-57]